uniref:Uncharacterized protein n=1 Tax=Ditylenchus dipsaci TaxID=166011 RepID=A0A915DHX9_9BILA
MGKHPRTKSKSDAEKSKKIQTFLNKMDKAVSEGGGTDTKTNKQLAKLQIKGRYEVEKSIIVGGVMSICVMCIT